MNWTLTVLCLCSINMCVNNKKEFCRFDIDWSNYFEFVSHGSACYIFISTYSFTLGTHAHFMFSWTSRFRFRLFGRRHAKVLFFMLWRIRIDGVARAWRMKMSNFSNALPINKHGALRWYCYLKDIPHIRSLSTSIQFTVYSIGTESTYWFAKCSTLLHSNLSTLPS